MKKLVSRYSKLNASEKTAWMVLLISVGFLLSMILYAILNPSPQKKIWREMWNVADEVCNSGRGFEEAPEYKSEGENTIVLASHLMPEMVLPGPVNRMKELSSFLPDDLIPEEGELPSLIGCIESKTVEIDVCSYIGGSDIKRYRSDSILTIRSVLTGEIIIEETFEGGHPRACKQSESSGTNRLFGESVQTSVIVDWIIDWLSQ